MRWTCSYRHYSLNNLARVSLGLYCTGSVSDLKVALSLEPDGVPTRFQILLDDVGNALHSRESLSTYTCGTVRPALAVKFVDRVPSRPNVILIAPLCCLDSFLSGWGLGPILLAQCRRRRPLSFCMTS